MKSSRTSRTPCDVAGDITIQDGGNNVVPGELDAEAASRPYRTTRLEKRRTRIRRYDSNTRREAPHQCLGCCRIRQYSRTPARSSHHSLQRRLRLHIHLHERERSYTNKTWACLHHARKSVVSQKWIGPSISSSHESLGSRYNDSK